MPDQQKIHIDFTEQQKPNGVEQKEEGICPVCGGETYHGYGMLGGGIGMYVDCGSCDWFYKWQDEE